LAAAVRDPFTPWAASPSALNWAEFGVAPDSAYFNAGVLLVPLHAWRAHEVSKQALGLLQSHAFHNADQCALNVVLSEQWVRLDPRWNFQGGHLDRDSSYVDVVERPDVLQQASASPAVIHFNKGLWRRPWAESGEPVMGWQANRPHPLRAAWFEDLDRTFWSGWRPEHREARPSRLRVIAWHLRGAARALVRGAEQSAHT
jgi:lipopolysaccharide biosynthesis glycosyltransferase